MNINLYKLFIYIPLSLYSLNLSAQPPSQSKFNFSAMPISHVISLYYKEVSKSPYFICNDVLTDTRTISVRAEGKTLDGPAFKAILTAYGYEARDQDGVTVVCKKAAVQTEKVDTFLYRVKHRDADYLELIS